MKQLNVFPECYVDTNLVCYLLGADVKHKSSCNEVVKALNKSNGFAVGVIDADKRMPTIDVGFVEHTQLLEINKNKHITMFIHEDCKRFLFTVKPAMDKFIMDAAYECGVELTQYGFPADLQGFKKYTKTIQAAMDSNLRRLFAEIKNADELKRFRNTIKYLTNKQYAADISVAKKFFDGELTSIDLVRYI